MTEYDFHVAYFSPRNFTIEAGEDNIVPLIAIWMEDNTVSLHIVVCDYGQGKGHAVDATGVTTSVLCNELPCAVGTSDIDAALNSLATYLESLTTDGYELDEIAEEDKGFFPEARVDAIIDM